MVGDALGAVLEFKKKLEEKDIKHACGMPGGGLHGVGPGQITDDGELSISQAHGLVSGKGELNLNAIASAYGNWFDSRPFDIGNTTRRALPKAVGMKVH